MLIKPYHHHVQYYETDQMGITHHSNYIRWMEEARVDFLNQIGWNFARLEASGITSPVIDVQCHYAWPTHFDEQVQITVTVTKFTGVKLSLAYIMTVNEQTVCTATSTHAFLGQDGQLIRLKRTHPEFAATLTSLVTTN
ncbi:acyl-CoA thioesterase [Limosilactobacillus equigenerosi]|nr:thioesterase family protein [Limosilactobacillus equigenerosi]